MRVFHVTSAEAAASILSSGFRDSTGSYMFEDFTLTGVWVADRPLDANEGAWGDTVLEVDIDEADIADFEIVEEGRNFREWCIPAAMLNRAGVRRSDVGDE
jgi:hypothetical protein